MTTHTLKQTGRTQCAAILETLTDRRGEWVPMPELVECSGSYNVHSRIADIRRIGYAVEHKNVQEGKKIHSFYRIR